MSCEICGRGSCTRSFHSSDEQARFDRMQEAIEDPRALYHRMLAAEERVLELECQLSAALGDDTEEEEESEH